MGKKGKIMLFILKEIYCLEDLKKKNYEKIIKVVCCFFLLLYYLKFLNGNLYIFIL